MTRYRKIKKSGNNITKKRRRILKRGGGQLPNVESKTIALPPINTLQNMYNKNEQQNQKGGELSSNYYGPTWGQLNMSTFGITNEQLMTFKRIVNSPMDCVISAMQIIGLLDFFSANVLRLTLVGQHGITLEEIENIFSLRTGQKFVFQPTKDINEFISTVNSKLPKNHVIFCGIKYTETCMRHVLLIGRGEDGRIIKIDPQSNKNICYLDTDNECIDEFARDTNEYYLLFNYDGLLTTEEREKIGIYM
jgi:hypothetical protein